MLIFAYTFFHYKWKRITRINDVYINKIKPLIKPEKIIAEIAKYKGKVTVEFDNIQQSESALFLDDMTLFFPNDGVNKLLFRHELGHVKSILYKKHKLMHFFSKTKFLRKIGMALGVDYSFEKEAWINSGYYYSHTYPEMALKAYRFHQIMMMFDLLVTILLVVIIIGLIF